MGRRRKGKRRSFRHAWRKQEFSGLSRWGFWHVIHTDHTHGNSGKCQIHTERRGSTMRMAAMPARSKNGGTQVVQAPSDHGREEGHRRRAATSAPARSRPSAGGSRQPEQGHTITHANSGKMAASGHSARTLGGIMADFTEQQVYEAPGIRRGKSRRSPTLRLGVGRILHRRRTPRPTRRRRQERRKSEAAAPEEEPEPDGGGAWAEGEREAEADDKGSQAGNRASLTRNSAKENAAQRRRGRDRRPLTRLWRRP